MFGNELVEIKDQMSKIKNILMLTCLRATELIEKRNFQRLSFVDEVQLKFHTKICTVCKGYEKQSALFDSILKREIAQKAPFIENKDLKEKILKNLK
jgi:hypothetical protein